MYKLIIVEDDPMVAEINKQYAEYSGQFDVAGIFNNGKYALDYIRKNEVDLIMLDYYMPIMTGRDFLHQLRGEHFLQDVIMVTAANDSRDISELYCYGILDYLIKPFDYARFQAALKLFTEKHEAFARNTIMNQADLDGISVGQDPAQLMDKGIHPVTLGTITDYLAKRKNKPLSIEDIAHDVPLSRVTLRRYMNYLISKNSVVSGVDYSTGGRPSAVYTYIGN